MDWKSLSSLASCLCIVAVALAGCLQPNESNPGNNEDPAIIDNEDSRFLQDTYEFHQLTNVSDAPIPDSIQVAGGHVAWTEGGFGNPVELHALKIGDNQSVKLMYPENLIPHLYFLQENQVLTSAHPYHDGMADTRNRTMIYWNLTSNSRTYQDLLFSAPTFPEGWNDDWILMSQDNGENYDENLIALNRGKNQTYDVYIDPGSQERLNNHFQVGSTAFYTIQVNDANTRTLVPVSFNLETREEMRPLVQLNLSLVVEAATPKYVYLVSQDQYIRHLYVLERETGEVQQLTQGNVSVDHVVAGGEWVLYEETWLKPVFVVEDSPEPQYYESTQVLYLGQNMQETSGSRSSLFPPYATGDFTPKISGGRYNWATDGEIVAFLATTHEDSPNIKYSGTQVYWMELPEEGGKDGPE